MGKIRPTLRPAGRPVSVPRLSAAGLAEDLDEFPPFLPSSDRVGRLTAEAAKEIGARKGGVFAGFRDLTTISVGCGATGDVWMQMLVDVLQIPVLVPNNPRYAGAVGCVLLRFGVGTPEYGTILDEESRLFEPRAKNADVCEKTSGVYQDLYPALKGTAERPHIRKARPNPVAPEDYIKLVIKNRKIV